MRERGTNQQATTQICVDQKEGENEGRQVISYRGAKEVLVLLSGKDGHFIMISHNLAHIFDLILPKEH